MMLFFLNVRHESSNKQDFKRLERSDYGVTSKWTDRSRPGEVLQSSWQVGTT